MWTTEWSPLTVNTVYACLYAIFLCKSSITLSTTTFYLPVNSVQVSHLHSLFTTFLLTLDTCIFHVYSIKNIPIRITQKINNVDNRVASAHCEHCPCVSLCNLALQTKHLIVHIHVLSPCEYCLSVSFTLSYHHTSSHTGHMHNLHLRANC